MKAASEKREEEEGYADVMNAIKRARSRMKNYQSSYKAAGSGIGMMAIGGS